jgi:hypothetical protein
MNKPIGQSKKPNKYEILPIVFIQKPLSRLTVKLIIKNNPNTNKKIPNNKVSLSLKNYLIPYLCNSSLFFFPTHNKCNIGSDES